MKADSSGRVRVAARIHEASTHGNLNIKGCGHIDTIHDVTPSGDGCADCLKTGDGWVHLRLCLSCGYVGCCDDSKNKHATRHHHETGHPLIASYEKGEDWIWCYTDQIGFRLKKV